jgi:hypothetical protein
MHATAGQKRILLFAACDNRTLLGKQMPQPAMIRYELWEYSARAQPRLVMPVTQKMVDRQMVAGWLETVGYTEQAQRWRDRMTEAWLLA